ncbi:hypothetical protein Pelo_11087 [Pelomyxa schiedti]|nr:hypothetical protein Pelo_11087 [Pelomyxa schiedti]
MLLRLSGTPQSTNTVRHGYMFRPETGLLEGMPLLGCESDDFPKKGIAVSAQSNPRKSDNFQEWHLTLCIASTEYSEFMGLWAYKQHHFHSPQNK